MKISTLGHYLMRIAALTLMLYGIFESGPLINWLVSKGLELYRDQTETWNTITLVTTIELAWPLCVGLLFGIVLWLKSQNITGIKEEEIGAKKLQVHFRSLATIMISTLGLYLIAFGLIMVADRIVPTIQVYDKNMTHLAENPELYKDVVDKPNPFVLLSPIYLPGISLLVGIFLTELRRPLARLIIPGSLSSPSQELYKSYQLFHRIVLTMFALLGFGFGLQWLGDAISPVYKFVVIAMGNPSETGMDYSIWANFASDIYAPMTQLMLAIILVALAKPVSIWLKPFKMPRD